MNRRVAAIREGHVPTIPGGEAKLVPAEPYIGTDLREAS
jgi:hypothetical protein